MVLYPSYENGFTLKRIIGKANSVMIWLTESVTTYGSVGIPALEALSSRMGVRFASIMLLLDGIALLPRTSACMDT